MLSFWEGCSTSAPIFEDYFWKKHSSRNVEKDTTFALHSGAHDQQAMNHCNALEQLLMAFLVCTPGPRIKWQPGGNLLNLKSWLLPCAGQDRWRQMAECSWRESLFLGGRFPGKLWDPQPTFPTCVDSVWKRIRTLSGIAKTNISAIVSIHTEIHREELGLRRRCGHGPSNLVLSRDGRELETSWGEWDSAYLSYISPPTPVWLVSNRQSPSVPVHIHRHHHQHKQLA